MYTEHFGLTEKPFSISPDPRYLYLSQRHADALAHLIYGISESGGFIQLTGEVGTGKTTLVRSLLEQLPEKTEIALVLNPPLTTQEFLASICQELRIDFPADANVKALIDRLNEYLLIANAGDRRVVLIVDEAQTLNPELLEQVRLLTNLETSKRKLLQIILIGQPELKDMLSRPEMRQIAQRITGRYHLEPLSAAEARIYIRHRLRVAGSQDEVFGDAAMRELYRLSKGIPRLINVIADRALLAAYTRDERRISKAIVRSAAREVFGTVTRSARWVPATAAAAVVAVAAVAAAWWFELVPGAARTDATAAAEGRPPVAATSGPVAAPADPVVLAVAGEPGATAGPEPAPAAGAGAEPAPLPLAEILAQSIDPRSAELATRALFGLWDVTFEPGDERGACNAALDAGLRCLILPGASLADLRQVDRPAVLELTDASGNRHAAVLRRLGRDSADLEIGGKRVAVSIADLTHAWYGDHWLLWRPATDVGSDLAPGMRSERVIWLREALAHYLGEAVDTTGADRTLFDATLAEQVRQFQRAHHLDVDGVLGSQTQIVLQADIGHGSGPTLHGEG